MTEEDAVFPGIDDDRHLAPDMSGGQAPAAPTADDAHDDRPDRKRKAKKRPGADAGPPQPPPNTSVYVTGLPPDVTTEELEKHFAKCGVLKRDPETGAVKIKIYRDTEGRVKGDGLVSYLRPESVDLAIKFLDESFLRPNSQLRVEPAKFELKADFVPQRRKAKASKAFQLQQQKALAWGFTEKEPEGPRVVILKRMFVPGVSDVDLGFYRQLKADVAEECERFGPVQKVKVFEGHQDGVVSVRFVTHQSAQSCVSTMNGRYFDGRQISAEFWDHKTDYTVKETRADQEKRLEEFGRWLEEQDEDSIAAATGGPVPTSASGGSKPPRTP